MAGRPPLIWVPDFFCNPSLEPLRRSDAKLRFYPIGADLRPDETACAELASRERPDIVVVVHYFGIPTDFSPLLVQLERPKQLVFEDAAHVLRPATGIGTCGDFVLYCPHKHLGIPHGAVLLSPSESVAVQLRSELAAMGVGAPAVAPWYLRKTVQRLLPDAIHRRLRPVADDGIQAEVPAPPLGNQPQMSPVARVMLDVSDIDHIAAGRRLADAGLREVLNEVKGWRPIHDAWGDAVPYRTVLRCDDERIAAARYSTLRRHGYPVEAWGSMAPEVKADPQAHGAARQLRATLIEFPFDVSRPWVAASLAGRALADLKGRPG